MKALALVDAPDHVCCRYRISAFAPALEATGGSLVIEGLARRPLARLSQLMRAGRYDAVVLQRKLLPGWQFQLLRQYARRLIFDVLRAAPEPMTAREIAVEVMRLAGRDVGNRQAVEIVACRVRASLVRRVGIVKRVAGGQWRKGWRVAT